MLTGAIIVFVIVASVVCFFHMRAAWHYTVDEDDLVDTFEEDDDETCISCKRNCAIPIEMTETVTIMFCYWCGHEWNE